MHDHRQRPAGDHLGVLDLEIDRHGLLDFGVGPAAGAEAVRPAEHHQPGAHLLRVAPSMSIWPSLNLLLAGDVGQDDRVVGLQVGQGGEELVARCTSTSSPCRRSRSTSTANSPGCSLVLDQQHLAFALDVGEGRGPLFCGMASSSGRSGMKLAS